MALHVEPRMSRDVHVDQRMTHAVDVEGRPTQPRSPSPAEPHLRAPRPAGWLRAVDLCALALILAGVWVLLSGGLRITIAGSRLSITSPERLMLLGAAIVVLRHGVRRRPSIVATLRSVVPRRLPSAWSAAAPVWTMSRFGVILVGYFAVLLIGPPDPDSKTRVSDDPLANLPARWDAFWYLDIAVDGYRWVDDPYRMQNVAFFPAYPWSMRIGGALLGAYKPNIRPPDAHLRMMLGGWLAALVTFWAALAFVYRWAESRAGPAAASTTIALLAAYPFAVYFSAPYSEPLYLLSVTATFIHFERMQWGRAAAWGFLAALVRPTGMLLIVPLAWLAFQRRARARQSIRFAAAMVGALAAPGVAVLLHSLVIYQLTGRPFAWSEVQVAWGRTYQLTTWLGLDMAHVAEHGLLNYVEAAPVTVLNGLGVVLAAAMLWPIAKHAGFAYALFVIVNLLPAIASGGLMSAGRFTSTLFPIFFGLAVVFPPRYLPALLVGFSLLQGLIAVLFFTWRPPF